MKAKTETHTTCFVFCPGCDSTPCRRQAEPPSNLRVEVQRRARLYLDSALNAEDMVGALSQVSAALALLKLASWIDE